MSRDHTSNAPSFLRRLPHLHALEVFAIAARSGSFSAASRQLCVTQGAVSRQILQIEQHLGAALFFRHKRGLRLTQEGEALLPIVEDALAKLGGICDALRNASQILTLRMPPTIAGRWFLPLLPSLGAVMPDVDVRVTTYDAWEPGFEVNDVDAAIIQGRGDWPDVEAIRLMPELLTPVCSPELARQISSPADIARLPLLHCQPFNAWALWLEAAGLGRGGSYRGQSFDTLELALSAATRGQGVALGDMNLIRESLQDGVLVAPSAFILDQNISYYLIYPPHRSHLPKIKAFRDWLVAAAMQGRSPE